MRGKELRRLESKVSKITLNLGCRHWKINFPQALSLMSFL
jgi:hypothetical protein